MTLTRMQEKIIRTLLKTKGGNLDIWQLSRKCGYLSRVIQSVEQLQEMGVVSAKDSLVRLTNKKLLPRYVVQKETPLKEVMKKFGVFRKEAIFTDNEYDQLPLLAGAIEHKLSLMLRENDLLNRDIVCLGDDDIFSVACSLSGLPKSITVLEKDKRVIEFLRKASKKVPVPIKVVQVDLARPLPERYHNSFDVCVSEPPDTVRGAFAFLSVGVQGLREGGVLYIGISESALRNDQWLEMEQAVTKSGIRFTDIIQDFEEYALDGDEQFAWKGFEKLPKWITKPAQKPWFVSVLLRGELVGAKNPTHFSLEGIGEDFLTNHLAAYQEELKPL